MKATVQITSMFTLIETVSPELPPERAEAVVKAAIGKPILPHTPERIQAFCDAAFPGLHLHAAEDGVLLKIHDRSVSFDELSAPTKTVLYAAARLADTPPGNVLLLDGVADRLSQRARQAFWDLLQ